jgi:putative transposase
MPLRQEILDEILREYQKPEDLLGEEGIVKQLTKALVERAMEGELTYHLGYEKKAVAGNNSGNSRNGKYKKVVQSKDGEMEIQVPRDRAGEYQPQIIKKGQGRFDGFDEKIISMYSRGMTTRDIQGHLEESYGVEVSPALISTVTEEVMEEVKAWQNRPLDRCYPIWVCFYLLAHWSKRR